MGKPRIYNVPDSDSDFSESDISMAGIPRHHRRRSVSRTRFGPSFSNTYLVPGGVHEDISIHRSASTGGNRRTKKERDRDRLERRVRDIRDRDHERDRLAPTNVIVDIKNESKNTSSNKKQKHREHSHHLEDNHYDYESEDDTFLRAPRHRFRARSRSASRSRTRTREPSPVHVVSPPPPPRDLELVVDQKLLEKNDLRQDFELHKQQLEIERLERELARYRGDGEVRLIKETEDRYEDDISDRLRRLQRFEEHERLEEEKRKAERRYRLQRLEQAEREAAEQEEVREKMRQERLKELQRKIDEEEERERIKKEIRDEEARQALAEQERMAKEAELKRAAIEEWRIAEERRRTAEREAAIKRDKEFRERLRLEFGYTEEEIEDIINKKHKKEKKEEKEEKKEEKKEKEKEKEEKKEEKREERREEREEEQRRATWIKVHRRHLLPDTLIAYQLPWSWDELDGNYIIIKTWISEELQEELFAHTRRLREGRLVTQTSNTLTELKVNDRKKDRMYLVRKKSPNRRSWIFT
ncbi:hypothetical protein BJX61DRAFT_537657 [Aspergillus egyptiacus]|nr:hypothetical protein BJX61DRAFT_537657 [Aspergillus egyptiacus]